MILKAACEELDGRMIQWNTDGTNHDDEDDSGYEGDGLWLRSWQWLVAMAIAMALAMAVETAVPVIIVVSLPITNAKVWAFLRFSQVSFKFSRDWKSNNSIT